MVLSFCRRAIIFFFLSSCNFLCCVNFPYLRGKRIRKRKWPERRHKQSDKVLVKNKQKVLAFFVILGKEGGQQMLNRFSIRNKSLLILTKNKLGSLTKSSDGLFAKPLHPQKLRHESSFGHFQFQIYKHREHWKLMAGQHLVKTCK